MAELKGTYSILELAQKYKCGIKTFRHNWLSQIKGLKLKKRQRLLTPKEVATIIEHLGEFE